MFISLIGKNVLKCGFLLQVKRYQLLGINLIETINYINNMKKESAISDAITYVYSTFLQHFYEPYPIDHDRGT